MKRSGIKRKTALRRTSSKRDAVIKNDRTWAEAVDANTNGKCVLALADPHHECRFFIERPKMEHHHVLSKQAHPELRHDYRNGVCACALAHSLFHSNGIKYVLDVLEKAGVYNVLKFVCEKKGFNMRVDRVSSRASFRKISTGRKKTELSESIDALKKDETLFIQCDHDSVEMTRLRTMAAYYSKRRTDGLSITASKVVNEKTKEQGMLLSLKKNPG